MFEKSLIDVSFQNVSLDLYLAFIAINNNLKNTYDKKKQIISAITFNLPIACAIFQCFRCESCMPVLSFSHDQKERKRMTNRQHMTKKRPDACSLLIRRSLFFRSVDRSY